MSSVLYQSIKNLCYNAAMPIKKRSTIKDFGKRLAQLRRAKGLTQTELGKRVRVSQRVITYYERDAEHPPTHLLIPIAKVLKISVDELLGLKNIKLSDTNHARFWGKLKKAEHLSRKDKKSLLDYLDALTIRSKSKN